MSHLYNQPYIVIGAIVERGGKILLVQENHLPDKNKWNIPAGKLDYGESPSNAIRREVFEETGLEFEPKKIIGIHSVVRRDVPGELGTTHVLRIVFGGTVNDNEPNNAHGEIEDGLPEIKGYAWMMPQEIINFPNENLRYHDTKDLISDWQAHIGYPVDLVKHFVQSKTM